MYHKDEGGWFISHQAMKMTRFLSVGGSGNGNAKSLPFGFCVIDEKWVLEAEWFSC
jgi:hypothetical protein